MRESYGCQGCCSCWGGLKTCHCAACHRTFTAITAFDKHRVRGKCHTPISVGLIDVGRNYVCWGFPSDGIWTKVMEALRERE